MVTAGGNAKLAGCLHRLASAAAPGSAMKPGDMLQVQRFTALLHKLRVSQAQGTMEEARDRLTHPQNKLNVQEPSLPDVPKHKPM